jgi:hypothetical protein
MSAPKCGTCRFWDAGSSERDEWAQGYCRRHAPQTYSRHLFGILGRMLWAMETHANIEHDEDFDYLAETNESHDMRWPRTYIDEACGDHQPKTHAHISLVEDQHRYDFLDQLQREKLQRKKRKAHE